MTLLGNNTKIYEYPIPVSEVPGTDKDGYFVLADARINLDGAIVNGDALAASETYHGALRALRHLGKIDRRIAVRRLGQ